MLMYSSGGDVINTTKDQGVEVKEPHCVVHDPHESAVITGSATSELIFLNEDDLTEIRRVKLQEVYQEICGVGVLSDSRLVVGTFNPTSISIYDRQGRRQHHMTKYGDQKVSVSCRILVLPDDTIVVSMYYTNHVVYLSPNLQSIQVVDIQDPVGLTLSPHDNILLIGRSSQYCTYHLTGQVGSIQSEVVMDLSDEVRSYGRVMSVAMLDHQMALVFENAICLYHWS